ncbi:hypothetical protein ACLOJK_025601 [Asimina triloba]
MGLASTLLPGFDGRLGDVLLMGFCSCPAAARSMAFLPPRHCCRLDLSHHGRSCNEEDDLLGVTVAGSASASGAETGLHGCWYVCPDPEQRRLTILLHGFFRTTEHGWLNRTPRLSSDRWWAADAARLLLKDFTSGCCSHVAGCSVAVGVEHDAADPWDFCREPFPCRDLG